MHYKIVFNKKYKKLKNENGYCSKIKLLDIININIENLSPQFLSYDTQNKFQFPKKGKYLMLLFLKEDKINILTTLRKKTRSNEKYYNGAVGKWFDVCII